VIAYKQKEISGPSVVCGARQEYSTVQPEIKTEISVCGMG